MSEEYCYEKFCEERERNMQALVDAWVKYRDHSSNPLKLCYSLVEIDKGHFIRFVSLSKALELNGNYSIGAPILVYNGNIQKVLEDQNAFYTSRYK